jgi:hypothetical protein
MRSLPSSKVSQPTTEREKPIVDIRAVNYRWADLAKDSWADLAEDSRPRAVETVEMVAYRVEIRRQGDVEWTEIPVVEREGKPR